MKHIHTVLLTFLLFYAYNYASTEKEVRRFASRFRCGPGSTVGGTWVPSRHLWLRIAAAAEAYRRRLVFSLILVGGHNVGVRYGPQEVFEKPDFSFQALTNAQNFPSEAEVMRMSLCGAYDIPRIAIFAETLSATTEENIAILSILLRRKPAFQEVNRVAIISQLYHLATPALRDLREIEGRTVEPLPVEDILREQNSQEIIAYYRDRFERTGNPFPEVDRLAHCMKEGRSVLELLA